MTGSFEKRVTGLVWMFRGSPHSRQGARDLIATYPGDGQESDQEDRGYDRRSADDEEMRQDGASHRGDERHRAEWRDRWHQESHGRSDFDEAGHVPEPLADADAIEQGDHRRRPRELRASCQQKHGGKRELHRPERDETNTTAVSVHRLKSG